MTERWFDVARATGLVRADGSVAGSIFAEMTDLAASTGALNLGQGFPDVDGPAAMLDAAKAAIDAGFNQYPPSAGTESLRSAVADHQARHYGITLDPESEVLVTTGASEALAATMLALVGPGDEVVTLEPYFDTHAATIALAGGTHRTVPMLAHPDGFRPDLDALAAVVGPRTRLVLLNSPHNPTGAVLTRAELEAFADAARRHDALVVTDEVYEHLVFDGVAHVPMASLPGMADRTVTISSAGKTFSVTGWKIGWLHGPSHLVTAIRTVKQYLTYASGAPFQPAVASVLGDDAVPRALAASLQRRRDLLCEGLDRAGLAVYRPQGTYFVVADTAPLGVTDGVQLCRDLAREGGVVGIPVAAFCRTGDDGRPSAVADALASTVRFTFVKQEHVLTEAVDRLTRYTAALR
ncbi:aminotransferase class I/II-fold pyridoxal phosphate-dependent enzyme [Paraoerskovia marina]|uniref:aminotransferase class I/II-fold pyridoxal phosphate-dependent enzyme n=1 Tax=Paraoerskovia marina TaxID=545619 RepID=UPI0005B7A2A4|nr:aminotransferase class I/II-fold pyridoxal phosphate-dependent enzyme [Paraoerskovia marina]